MNFLLTGATGVARVWADGKNQKNHGPQRFSRAILIAFCCVFLTPSADGQVPSNSNATNSARSVLRFLGDLKGRSGNRLLLGQDLGHGNSIANGFETFARQLSNQTGKWVGLIGGDYGTDPNHDVWLSNQVFINHWNQGGLVTLSWHFDNPWTGGNSWDTTRNENLWELLSPGTRAYDTWQAQKRAVANALRPLRDAGVVVLWRPFHEMNGEWFWWGRKDFGGHETAYVALWQDLYNYLSYGEGMNNLLWVYSTAVTWDRTLRNYYPGREFVDVTGIDIYDWTVSTYDSQRDYQDLRSLGHPMGLTEFGPSFDATGNYDYRLLISNLRSKYPDFVFSHAWHNWFEDGQEVKVSYANNRFAWETFNDPLVVTREEIQLGSTAPPVNGANMEGLVRFRNRATGYYLTQDNNQLGSPAKSFRDETWWSQQWYVEALDGQPQRYRLRNRSGNRYLNGWNNRITSHDSEWRADSQRWVIEQVDGNYVRIRNFHSGQYVTGGRLLQDIWTQSLNTSLETQEWAIEYVSN